MKLKEIKKNGFYTDGEYVYKKEKNNSFTTFTDVTKGLKNFIDAGVRECGIYPYMLENEVRIVEDGEEFFNGNIKVINKKTLDVLDRIAVNRKVDKDGYTTSVDGYEEKRKIINF